MLVKAGDGVVLNMTGIDTVLVRPTDKITYENETYFSKGPETKTTEYQVEIYYRNVDGVKDSFTIKCGKDMKQAMAIKNEVLSQVKEIESVGTTQALEEAIKNG